MPGAEVGMQSYTFRRFNAQQAAEKIAATGATAVELAQSHLPLRATPQEAQAVRDLFAARGIRVCGYGVVSLSDPKLDLDALFRLAADLDLDYLSADVRPDDAAAQHAAATRAADHGLRLALHNHGPGHHYATAGDLARALGHMPAAFGACADTGHFQRAGADPVAAIRALAPRVYAAHIKDFIDDTTETVPGAGRLDLVAAVSALREQGFATAYVIEYEGQPDDPTEPAAQAVAAVRAALG